MEDKVNVRRQGKETALLPIAAVISAWLFSFPRVTYGICFSCGSVHESWSTTLHCHPYEAHSYQRALRRQRSSAAKDQIKTLYVSPLSSYFSPVQL
jgi:hypothetical protein